MFQGSPPDLTALHQAGEAEEYLEAARHRLLSSATMIGRMAIPIVASVGIGSVQRMPWHANLTTTVGTKAIEVEEQETG